jgi:hypothetical protein
MLDGSVPGKFVYVSCGLGVVASHGTRVKGVGAFGDVSVRAECVKPPLAWLRRAAGES